MLGKTKDLDAWQDRVQDLDAGQDRVEDFHAWKNQEDLDAWTDGDREEYAWRHRRMLRWSSSRLRQMSELPLWFHAAALYLHVHLRLGFVWCR